MKNLINAITAENHKQRQNFINSLSEYTTVETIKNYWCYTELITVNVLYGIKYNINKQTSAAAR